MLIDLSHSIEHGMITYKGLPAPLICDFLSREASRARYAPGTEFHIGRIDMVANTGTYLDSPFHRFADGKDLSELPLRSLAGLEAICVRAPAGQRALSHEIFSGLALNGKAVLVQTGWDRHWRTDAYFEGHPFLTADAAQLLVESGVKLVGIDSYNIDDTADLHRPAHTVLLGHEIPIVEHMTGLHQLPEEGFKFSAVPPKIRAFGTFPVRAFATINGPMPVNASGPVRAMKASDLPAVLALWRQTEGVGLGPEETEPMLARYLERNPGLSKVAIMPPGVLAGAVLCGHDGRRGYLYHLAVAPEFRNHGLGRALVGSCLIDLRACGLAKVSILIYSHNDHGRAFWEHLNWHSRPDLELMQTGL